MTNADSSPAPLRSPNPWLGVMVFVLVSAFFLGVLTVATRAFLPLNDGADPWLQVFLGLMWIAALLALMNLAYAAVLGLRNGRTTLRLDVSPVRIGEPASGILEAPDRLQWADVSLFVECIKTSYALKVQRQREWEAVALLDGARLEHVAGKVIIPFSIALPESCQPTSDDSVRKIRINWTIRAQASIPGLDYDVAFEIPVHPGAGPLPRATRPPARSMPELGPAQLAARFDGAFEAMGDAKIMRLPFPLRLAAATTVCAAGAIALVPPGFPWPATLHADARLGLALVCAGLAALLGVALMFTPRAIEVHPRRVLLRRGLWGLGIHTALATSDIVAVEETVVSIEDSVGGYGVGLKMRDGRMHAAVKRLRNPTQARALAGALRSILPGK